MSLQPPRRVSLLTARPALRWAVPATVVGVVAAVAGGSMLAANATPSLPARTASQLLVDLQNAHVDGFSGTVVQNADLSLPALPNVGGGQGSSSLSSLISGAHTWRVWQAGTDKTRLALLGTLGESDVIRNGKDLWLWSSQENKATHYTLPEGSSHAQKQPPADLPKTPQEAADRALKAIDPSTKVTTDGTASVAGRPVYELVVTPRDTASKIGQVRIAIDEETKIPLRVKVLAKGSTTPAIEVGFTQLSVAVPGDEHFRFTTPPGATVEEQKPEKATNAKPDKDAAPQRPTVIGSGWTSVLVARGIKLPGKAPADAPAEAQQGLGQLSGVLDALPKVSGTWGSGRLLESRLFSALLTDDGRLLVGAVGPDLLYAAAADPAAR